jgi:hypothetical protein
VDEAFERELVAFYAMITDGTPPLTGLAGGLSDLVTSQRIVRRHGSSTGTAVSGEAEHA